MGVLLYFLMTSLLTQLFVASWKKNTKKGLSKELKTHSYLKLQNLAGSYYCSIFRKFFETQQKKLSEIILPSSFVTDTFESQQSSMHLLPMRTAAKFLADLATSCSKDD